ncbi:SusD-like starch-binding protein associating with outer membrane [Arcticibacter tournemirensis]|uniref:RagB/SusD family nutrient uptake outer membrane protein n=1 Tax=Arcticibacter tournemirensis TaxID=699437 RepID=A0A5M9HP95_9SPHI|nr:RagB/SusD family nutrient uptake outer membrane protein [Arcticibacter tournemirensis]KAA8486837.1 RagB/SusD family nutrient uptake outer membrane protein [Arcticibacter tournemirensis]TQM49385.1 SusD-like starch-binding protein associating with outer membrane [Arcticibacter tournemirensis]
MSYHAFSKNIKVKASLKVLLLIFFSCHLGSCKKDASNEESLTIEVYDATQWSADFPDGRPAESATVSLYLSKQDYKDKRAFKSQKTDINGSVVINAAPGSYFIVAEKERAGKILSNVVATGTSASGLPQGFALEGLFQSEQEINNSPGQAYAKPGNFKRKDINGDGIVNEADLAELPYASISVGMNGTPATKIIIGAIDNSGSAPIVKNATDLKFALNAAYLSIYDVQKQFNATDAVLSDDADGTGSLTGYRHFDDFSFDASEGSILTLWNTAFSAVTRINTVIYYASYIDLPSAEKELFTAEAKGLRGYVYLMLGSYFGNVPVITSTNLSATISPVTQFQATVFQQVNNDLEEAHRILPLSWPESDRYRLSKAAAAGLLAKLAITKKDYNGAYQYTTEVINSNKYLFSSNANAVFESLSDKEILWNVNQANQETYFYETFGRGRFHSILRLTEIYLIMAEAQLATRQYAEASSTLSILAGRRNIAFTPFANAEEGYTQLQSIWKQEMFREGNRFTSLIRWNKAAEVLGNKGFKAHHILLPIPERAQQLNSHLQQNPGY